MMRVIARLLIELGYLVLPPLACFMRIGFPNPYPRGMDILQMGHFYSRRIYFWLYYVNGKMPWGS